MMISLLLQAFFLNAIPVEEESAPLRVEASEPVREYETIEGVEETTGISFAHTLPTTEAKTFGPQRVASESLGILTSAESAIVIDRRTSNLLFAKAPDEKRPIASMTKLMTAYTLIQEGIDFNAEITIHPADFRAGGRIHLYTGEIFSVQDVWMAGLIASDNVAIAALVRSTGLSETEFAHKMTQYANELGMQQSSFVEPTGIDRQNISTARDLARLLNETMSIPMIAETVRRPKYSFSPRNKEAIRTVENTNELLSSFVNEDPYKIIGGKTGFTYEAGYCLGVVADGPSENDELIVVVLGADSLNQRFTEVKGLVDWTYRNYQW